MNKLIPFKPLSVRGDGKVSVNVFGVTSSVYANKMDKIGTVFFMDVDTELDLAEEMQTFLDLMDAFYLSHLIFLETRKGLHIINFDIYDTKVELFELFRYFKMIYDVDYEFGYDWILRLTNKERHEKPVFKYAMININPLWKCISEKHLKIYEQFIGLPKFIRRKLKETNFMIDARVRFVKYQSWNY